MVVRVVRYYAQLSVRNRYYVHVYQTGGGNWLCSNRSRPSAAAAAVTAGPTGEIYDVRDFPAKSLPHSCRRRSNKVVVRGDVYVYIFSFSDDFVIVPNAFARPRVQAYLACPLLLVRASTREDRARAFLVR